MVLHWSSAMKAAFRQQISTKTAELRFMDGFCKKSASYNTYSSDSSSWILNGLVSSCFDKCWYIWWRKRHGKGHSLWTSGRSNGTDDTKLDISQPRISESAKLVSKWHVCSSYFMFPFYFTPENLRERSPEDHAGKSTVQITDSPETWHTCTTSLVH